MPFEVAVGHSVLWTLIYQCTVNTISHKCTGDTKFGVRIVTYLGHQIWCPGDTKFFTVYVMFGYSLLYMKFILLVNHYISIIRHKDTKHVQPKMLVMLVCNNGM